MSDNFSDAAAAAIVTAILLAQRGTMSPSQGDVDEAAASAARIVKAARAALTPMSPSGSGGPASEAADTHRQLLRLSPAV